MINALRNSAVGYRRRGGFGPVLNVSNCVNSGTAPYDTFANATPNGFDAASDTDSALAGTADELSFVNVQKYLIVFDLVLNSGALPIFAPRPSLGAGDIGGDGFIACVEGANTHSFTANATTIGVISFWNNSKATDFEITNLSVRQIL